MLQPLPNPNHSAGAAYLNTLSPSSIPTMLAAMSRVSVMLGGSNPLAYDWATVRYPQALEVRSRLAATLAPATANKHLAALRGVLRQAAILYPTCAAELALAATIHNVRGSSEPTGRELQPAELERLLDMATVRDRAIIACLYGAGLRLAECASLQVGDWDGHALNINGKGNKHAKCPVGSRFARLVNEWVAARTEAGTLHGKLFELSESGIRYTLETLAMTAGVADFTRHDLRRSCATHLIDAGVPLSTVQDTLRHADISTTKRYDMGSKRRVAAAVELLGGIDDD